MENLFEFVKQEKSTNPVTVFLTDELDRIARDADIHNDIKARFRKFGLKLVTVRMTFEENAYGEFMEAQIAIYAQFLRKQGLERTIRCFNSRLRDGFRTRAAPVGYKYTKSPKG